MSFPEFSDKVRLKILPATRVYYIRKTGSDANDGLTAATAYLTLAKAFDQLHAVDFIGQHLIFDIGAGNWTNEMSYEGGWLATILLSSDIKGPVTIRGAGNTTIIDGQSVRNGISLVNVPYHVTIQGLKFLNCLISISSNHSLSWLDGVLTFVGNNLNSGGAISCVNNSYMSAGASCIITLSGDFYWSLSATFNSTLALSAALVFSSPTHGYAAVHAAVYGCLYLNPGTSTVTGSATGTRYHVYAKGLINTGGRGENLFPGTVAGNVATDGLYI
ncbi:MAG: hypothetical protein LBT47_01000 [Deltaproteobacteria bacterium]|jgi:hypothetical protein|nr:hypothetical protein [Deltaproteobacteria bacterium]